MTVAVIRNTKIMNTVLFEDIRMAQQFLNEGVFGDADMVVELQDGYEIGDYYINGEWIEKESVENQDVHSLTLPTLIEKTDVVDMINSLLEKINEVQMIMDSYDMEGTATYEK